MTLLSYNVEGLPWPIADGRGEAAAEIARTLQAMQNRGAGPQVVAIQEAFGAAQKAIGREAGYPYAAFGPNSEMAALGSPTVEERAFLASASALHGETEGPQEDSGLAVFSNYPIVWFKRTPFPRFACAGYDCLANKGLLAVALRLPGHAAPVVVMDTHLNARTASGVDDARSFAAYRRQVDLVSAAIRNVAATGSPVVLAGDFNVGSDPRRASYLAAALIIRDGLRVAASENTCGATCRRTAAVPAIARSKTLILYGAPAAATGPTLSFGLLPDGLPLSDHLGVAQAFALNVDRTDASEGTGSPPVRSAGAQTITRDSGSPSAPKTTPKSPVEARI